MKGETKQEIQILLDLLKGNINDLANVITEMIEHNEYIYREGD